MGIVQLSKVSIIAPRLEADKVIRELFKFGDFYPVESESSIPDSKIESLMARVKKVETSLDYVISEYGIKSDVGVIEAIVKGVKIEKHKLEAKDIESLIESIESEAYPIVNELQELSVKLKDAYEELQRNEALLAMLTLLKDLRISPHDLTLLRRFYVILSIVPNRDVEELRRSLPEASILSTQVSKNLSAVLIISTKAEIDRVDRVLKGFGVKPFTIPEELPKMLPEACLEVERDVLRLKSEIRSLEERRMYLLKDLRTKILSLREASSILRESLERLRFMGDMKNFIVLEGYVPKERCKEIEDFFKGRYPIYILPVEVHGSEAGHAHTPPTILKNKGPIKAFERITEIQGLPSYNEIDPTPLVAIFFSIFYGIMFADFGQGIVLAIFGFIMYIRTKGWMRDWGMLLAILGISSSTVGFLLGECFGFKMAEWGIKTPEIIHLVEEHAGVKELNLSSVHKLLQFTIMLGALHLLIGYTMSAYNSIKHKEYAEVFTSKLPTILMYIFGIMFALAFFGAGGINEMLTSQNPAPIIGVPSYILGNIGVLGGIACIFMLILGRPIVNLIKGNRAGFIGAAGTGMLEVLENIIHFLSNTISYARLTILLLVHVALMLLVNNVWYALGIASIPILIIGNLGIMALEGMIVFIQSLRLHLYEFFTKFFEGSGRPFKPLKPETVYVDIEIK